MGSSVSRNIGVGLSSKELVLFFDDDCIFMSKEALSSMVYSFNEKQRQGNHMGAIHLPVYYRSNQSKDVLPINEILGIDYQKIQDSIREIWLNHPTVLDLRRVLDDVKGFPGICAGIGRQEPADE